MKKELTNDMTVGSPAKAYHGVYDDPMCLGNIFQQLLKLRIPSLRGSFWESTHWRRLEVQDH